MQSNLAAILMSTTPLSSTVLGHLYLKNEKFNFVKTIGILIGFSGIVFLFSDNLLIDENNFFSFTNFTRFNLLCDWWSFNIEDK